MLRHLLGQNHFERQPGAKPRRCRPRLPLASQNGQSIPMLRVATPDPYPCTGFYCLPIMHLDQSLAFDSGPY